MKKLATVAIVAASLALQGCFVTFHVIGDVGSLLGPRHHPSFVTKALPCHPYPQCHQTDPHPKR